MKLFLIPILGFLMVPLVSFAQDPTPVAGPWFDKTDCLVLKLEIDNLDADRYPYGKSGIAWGGGNLQSKEYQQWLKEEEARLAKIGEEEDAARQALDGSIEKSRLALEKIYKKSGCESKFTAVEAEVNKERAKRELASQAYRNELRAIEERYPRVPPPQYRDSPSDKGPKN